MEKISLLMFLERLFSKITNCYKTKITVTKSAILVANLLDFNTGLQKATLNHHLTQYNSSKKLFDAEFSFSFKALATLAIVCFLSFSSQIFGQVANVNPPLGGFAIDGGLRANTPISNQGDWYPGIGGTGGSVFSESGAPIAPGTSASSGRSTGENYNNNDNVFTNGSKFNDYVSDLKWFTNSAPDKNDINNAMYHVARASNNDQWIFISGDRLSTNGTSYIDFELSQGTITQNDNGTFTGIPAAGKPSGGGRTENDIIISMEYINGGSKPNVYIYQWKKSGNTWSYQQLTPSATLLANAFAETNRTGEETNLPYLAFGTNTYQQYAFVEAAVNISQLLAISGQTCTSLNIQTLWVKTKAAASSTAALKDFITPIPVNLEFGSTNITAISAKCADNNTPYLLTATPSGGTFSGPGVSLVSGSYYFTPSAAGGAGLKTISYTSADGSCTGSIMIRVNAVPTITPGSYGPYCIDAAAATLGGTPSGGTWSGTGVSSVDGVFKFTPSTAGAGTFTLTYSYTDGNSCSKSATSSVTVNAATTAPGVTTPVVYCLNTTAAQLTATGTSLLWYTAATGGTGSATAPTPSTTSAGSTTHFVSQRITTNGVTCEGAKAPIVVTINSETTAPSVSTPVVYCLNATAAQLTATGTSLKWYTLATGGTGNTTAPTPLTTTAGSTTHYVSQTLTSNGIACEGARAPIVVTINGATAAPSVTTPVVYCLNATASQLSATGTSLLWYTAATGGIGSATAPTPSTSTAGSTTHHVSQTVTTNGVACEGAKAPIVVTINEATAAPSVATPVVYCLNATAAQLTATGTSLKWYTLATGGTGSAIAPTPQTTVAGSTTHYVSQTVTTNGVACEGARAPIVVTVNAATAAPSVTTPVAYCLNATAAQLTATGTSLKWYTLAIGGTGSATAPTPSTSTAGSTTFHVSQTVTTNGVACEGTRAPIVVTINALPTLTLGAYGPYCVDAATATLGGLPSGGMWSGMGVSSVGGVYKFTPSVAGVGEFTLTYSYTDGNFCSNSDTSRVTVKATPSGPSITYNAPACDEATFSITLSGVVSGAQYTVRDKNGSAISGISPASPYTATNTSNITFSNIPAGSGYQVTTTVNGCSSNPAICPVAPAAKIAQTDVQQTKVTNDDVSKVAFEVYPVPFKDELKIKYNFDYVSDVKIKIFNSQGIQVFSKSDTNSYLGKEIALDLKMNSGRQQVYIVQVTTNQGSSVKKVISSN